MPQVINTNVSSLNSQRSLNTSQASLTTSLQRLSSGLRINSAKDDAAGLAISSRMSSQISGLNQASRNANDGISLAQTAEGGLESISDSLQRMRELAVQSSNASNTSTDRAAIQTEVNQLIQQINTVGGQTAFNGVKLLDGSFNSQSFQIGANTGEKITISSIASAKADALGVGTTSSYSTSLTSTVTTGAIATGGITVNGFGVGPSVGDGVSSSLTVLSTVGTTGTSLAAGDIKINGVSIGPVGATTAGTAMASAIVTAIGASVTNVTATNNAGVITLTSKNGTDITLELTATAATNSGLTAGTTKVGADSAIAKAAAFNTVTGQTGVSAVATTTTFTTAAALSSNAAVAGDDTDYIKINGVKLGAIAAGTNANFTDQGNNVVAAINAVSNQTGVTATFDNTSTKISLAAADGRTITVEAAGTAVAANVGFAPGTANTYGGLKLTSSTSAGINVGGANIGTTALTAGYTAATATFGAGIASVDLTTASGAANAISTIDAALSNINSSRANLGAVQNRFSSVVSNLAATSENLTASRSRIMDTDFAAETASLSRNQILQQAGTAMLAQANSLPQGVLALLRG
ncbi:MAG: flagellin [Candidatus Accumulibacter propinquus]|jgi:flagellin|uniref:flagellin N-terminal helical domain-containing protein n=1 Tax=Candidatus Accumulibacter propinquus TaxID=2954380 RepID=UPI002FC32868